MKARAWKRAKPRGRRPCGAERRWQTALKRLNPDAPELFSDRQEDAVEVECVLRDFERAHDEALGAERYA